MKRILLLTFIYVSTNTIGQNDRFFNKIDSLVREQQVQSATDLLQQFISEHPGRYYDHAKAYLLMSYNDLQLGNFDGALARNQKSMELRERLRTDDVAENYMQLGAIYLKQSNIEQALIHLYKAKDLPSEDPQLSAQINSYLATAFVEKKDYEQALNYLEESLKLLQIELGATHPDVSATYFQMAKLYKLQGDLKKAELHLKKSLEIELKNPDTYLLKVFPNSFIIPLLQRFFTKS